MENLKKIVFLLIFILFDFNSMLHADELAYKVIENTPAWHSRSMNYKLSNAEIVIPKGVIVQSAKGALTFTYIDEKAVYFDKVIYENKIWRVNNRFLIPANTEYLFDQSLLTDPSDPNRPYWIMSFYQDILLSKDRTKIDLYHESYIENRQKDVNQDEYTLYWFEYIKVPESLIISQSAIAIGDFRKSAFCIKNIVPYKNGYSIQIYGSETFQGITNDANYNWWYLPELRNKKDKVITLILIIDGDYMDIYMDTMENKVASVMKANQHFVDELNHVFSDNTADLSNINWPTRDDGSMDYLIPSNVLLQNFIPTHKTKEEIPLLSEDSTESTTVATLPAQTPLRWIAKGTKGRIKILTPNGLEGWCSTEKLENLIEKAITYEAVAAPNIPKPVQVEEADSKDEENDVDLTTVNSKEYEGLSPANQRYLRILIVSFGIIMLMIVLLKLLRKKKS